MVAFNKYLAFGLYIFIVLGNGYSSEDSFPCAILNGLPGICKLAKARSESAPNRLRKSQIACNLYRNQRLRPLTFHIFSSNLSSLGEFPHMAALGYLSEENNTQINFKCGGSLIAERYILTAAHCAASEQPSVARLGTINIINPETDPETYGNVVDVNIERFIVHPDYKVYRRYHDIALIYLSKAVTFAENVQPICLNTDLSDILPSTELIFTGWGKKHFSSDEISLLLKKIKLSVMNLSECNVSLSRFFGRQIPSGLYLGQFCTYDPKGNSGPCQGDTGAPVQIFNNLTDDRSMPIVIGVLSFGVACGTKLPSVYTRVAFYLDWIESYVWPN